MTYSCPSPLINSFQFCANPGFGAVFALHEIGLCEVLEDAL